MPSAALTDGRTTFASTSPSGAATPPPVVPSAPAARPVAAAAPAASSPGSYKGVAITAGTDAQIQAQMAAIDAKNAGPSIVSSNSVIDAKNGSSSVENAGNALTATHIPDPNAGRTDINGNLLSDGSPADGSSKTSTTGDDTSGPVDPTVAAALATLKSNNDATQANFQSMQAALKMTFDANLGAKNQQYAALFQTLSDNHTNALGVAAQNAAALNPYSTAKGATTNANFMESINAKFVQQATTLQAQADAAQAQLEAGNYSAYVNLQKQMTDTANSFNTNVTNTIQDYLKSQATARALASTQKEQAVDDYTTALTTAEVPDPKTLAGMTDTDIMKLTAVKKGLAAGYDIDSIKQDLTHASALKQQDVDLKEQQIRNETRLANSVDKPSDAQVKAQTLGSIANQFQKGQVISPTAIPALGIEANTPVLGASGRLTADAWKFMRTAAPGEGLSSEDLLKEFGSYMVNPDGTIDGDYNLTPAEQKILLGTLPGP